ncbi:hypothetical protein E2C01_056262 [Portunus trituberculatus]|uniref:Secreted protein n=1 Tax=Portunus trituberculatus TaxID=210409 RepID=A0A5B7GXB2_PORTR|nr:hypothetical protein [Portunus trituberculatus]
MAISFLFLTISQALHSLHLALTSLRQPITAATPVVTLVSHKSSYSCLTRALSLQVWVSVCVADSSALFWFSLGQCGFVWRARRVWVAAVWVKLLELLWWALRPPRLPRLGLQPAPGVFCCPLAAGVLGCPWGPVYWCPVAQRSPGPHDPVIGMAALFSVAPQRAAAHRILLCQNKSKDSRSVPEM